MKKTSNHPQKRRLPLWMTRVTFVAGGLIVLLMIIFAATILQKLFFKYVFKDAADEDKNAGIRRQKKLDRELKKKQGRSAV